MVVNANAISTGFFAVTRTKRGRWLWAAWWTCSPSAKPFAKPDAANGGASTEEEAKRQAESAAGRALIEIHPRWATAWNRALRGQDPWPGAPPAEGPVPYYRPTTEQQQYTFVAGTRAWAFAVLHLRTNASVEEVRKAFRKLVLKVHPDHQGTSAEFIDVYRAYQIALNSATSRERKHRKFVRTSRR